MFWVSEFSALLEDEPDRRFEYDGDRAFVIEGDGMGLGASVIKPWSTVCSEDREGGRGLVGLVCAEARGELKPFSSG